MAILESQNVAADLVKMKTMMELYVGDKDNLAHSKSYIYLAKGLSDELLSDLSSQEINYRSAFFENDHDLEDYHR